MQACDTVIFLDYSVEICLLGIKERKGKPRTDIPFIESANDHEFIEFIKNYNLNNRPDVINLIKKYSNKDIYIFKNRTQANEFLDKYNKNYEYSKASKL